MPCYWYVLGSSTPKDSGGTLHAHPTTTTSYVIKMDLCGRVTYDTVKVNVWPLGLLSINAPHQQWQLYPNPNTGNFKLRCNQEINEKVTIQVFDLLGSLVYQQVSANVKTDITVDCAALPTAIYILKIVPDEGVPTVFRFNKN